MKTLKTLNEMKEGNKDYKYKFEDIFDDAQCMWVAKSFRKGVAFKLDSTGTLTQLVYKDEQDMNPFINNAIMYKDLLKKKYSKVYNRYELFR